MANRPKKAGVGGRKKKSLQFHRIMINIALGAVMLVFVAGVLFFLFEVFWKKKLFCKADKWENIC